MLQGRLHDDDLQLASDRAETNSFVTFPRNLSPFNKELDMALHASWIHGTTFRAEWIGDTLFRVVGGRWDGSTGEVPWSDINGLPRGWGTTFRGKRSEVTGFGGARTAGPFDPANPFQYSLKGYWFHAAVPTPIILFDRRSRLLTVFVLWTSTAGVRPAAVHVWHGPSRIAALGVNAAAAGTGRSGAGGLPDLVNGVSRFALPAPVRVLFPINISVGVTFANDGDITFHAAGADFDDLGS
jgi:hypothetical protein